MGKTRRAASEGSVAIRPRGDVAGCLGPQVSSVLPPACLPNVLLLGQEEAGAGAGVTVLSEHLLKLFFEPPGSDQDEIK